MAVKGKSKKKSVLLAIESTPGVSEVLSASDGAFYKDDIQFSPDITQHEVNQYKGTLGTEPSLAAQRKAIVTFKSHLAGSGVISNAPPFATMLKMCGMAETGALVRIPLGAVTVADFAIDEVVTQAAASATGIVCMAISDGMPFLFVYATTGTFDSTEIVGNDSGATVTPSGAPVENAGFMYRPITTGLQYGSVEVHIGNYQNTDAMVHKLSYCLGNVQLAYEVGNRVMLEMELKGRLVSSDRNGTFIQGTRHTVQPPQWMRNQAVQLHEGYSAVIKSARLNLGNSIEPLENANDPSGFDETSLVDRAVVGSIDPKLVMGADAHDFFNKVYNNTIGAVTWQIGDTDGNRFFAQMPHAQLLNPSDGEDNNNEVINLDLQGNDVNDDAMVLIAT